MLTMAKDKIIIWIVVIVVGILVLYNSNSFLFSIFTPKAPPEITDYVNKYYFPTVTKTINFDKCSVPSVTIGTSFSWDTTTLPTGNDYIFYNGQYYRVSRVSGKYVGTCTKLEGNQTTIDGKAPFRNFLFIQKGTNYLLCRNLDSNKYEYSQFSLIKNVINNRYYIKYSIPQIEPEGKYYCDNKNTIYRIPCGGKTKEVIETCSLGCEYADVQIDSNLATVNVVKCKGDFQPNKQICSTDGKKIYTVDSSGKLTTGNCCSCTNGVCSKTVGCAPAVPACNLLKGDGKNQINVFIVDYKNNKNYSDWIIDFMPTQIPYNEFTYNFYAEATQYACRGKVAETSKDLRIAWDSQCNWAYACANPTNSYTQAGYLSFTFPKYAQITKSFLLMHESGHDYLHYGHTCDGSIMDANGGTRKNGNVYESYQVPIVRYNLANVKFKSLPWGNYSCP